MSIFTWGLLAACTLVKWACTCPDFVGGQIEKPPVVIQADHTDSAYVTINGRKEVLLGFDLTKDGSIADQPNLIDQIVSCGGNLLLLDTARYSRENWQRLSKKANDAEVLLNPVHLPIEAVACTSAGAFNGKLLEGAGAVIFTSFSQKNLNAIRAVRLVERQVKLYELHINPDLLLQEDSPDVIAADDGKQNYVVYTPGSARIDIKLDEEQYPRRVTVVGHLGTQRSEVLHPPYDRYFTLLSNDEQGGWLIIKKAGE